MLIAGRRLVAYLTAVLWAAAGLAVTALLVKPFAGVFFIFQFATVVGAALYGGLGPGLLAMVLCCGGSFAMFFAPSVEPYVLFRLGSFGLVSALFAGLAARVRHARAVAERAQARSASAEAEAKAIGEQQERLVAVVGHDLRSPLFAINLTVELLRNVGQDPVRRSEGLLRIAKSAERMQSMVRDLLDFARARHGAGLPVHLRPLRLGDLCRAALEEVRTAQPSGTVVFDVSGDDSAALDPARVEQVVTNLVTNALQHGPAGAPVKVAVQGAGDAVRLTVMNQGPPIPTDLLATCFEPFRKGRASDSIGLGLFIVREIATAHGGSVSVASDGQETTFTVLFPRSSADADRLPAAGPRPPGALDY